MGRIPNPRAGVVAAVLLLGPLAAPVSATNALCATSATNATNATNTLSATSETSATSAANGAVAGPQDRRPEHTLADVRFMRHMLVHHEQAVEMTDLAEERAEDAGVRLLAERIALSQASEMDLMRRWLEARGESAMAHGRHAHSGGGMPGMIGPVDMERLAASRGAAFDRLFLELMIRHHEGALVMVAELFEHDGAGQEPEIFAFATHVDGDQRAEVARMRAMLDALAPAD